MGLCQTSTPLNLRKLTQHLVGEVIVVDRRFGGDARCSEGFEQPCEAAHGRIGSIAGG